MLSLLQGRPLPSTEEGSGALCIGSVWPGIARTVFGDHKRYQDTYFAPFPGYYFSGDGAMRWVGSSTLWGGTEIFFYILLLDATAVNLKCNMQIIFQ